MLYLLLEASYRAAVPLLRRQLVRQRRFGRTRGKGTSQEPTQAKPCLMKLGLGVSDRASQFTCDFAVRFTLNVVQQKNRPVSRRKFSQGPVQSDAVYRTLQIQVF